MNFIKRSLLLIFLSILLIYTVNVTGIPNKIVLFENEELNLSRMFGITLKEVKCESIQASSTNNKIENKTLAVSLFNVFNLKKIEVSTIENVKVVPLGNTIGIKLYSSGVLVIGMTEVEGKKPYENSGIKEGDLIIEVDNIQVTTTEKLISCVNNSEGKPIEIKYLREGEEHKTNIEPIKTKDDIYKIGLWVRDGAVGIGTATFYEPETGKIATLGHGIIDRDTEKLISIESGELLTANITKIRKGEKGTPGEIRGMIDYSKTIGTIYLNTGFGIYGMLQKVNALAIDTKNEMQVALKDEIRTGKATILLALEDGMRREYEIEIKKIYRNNTQNNKSMLIEVTDEELIKQTGGIVQGMSGAPIIQDNKFVRSNNACSNK